MSFRWAVAFWIVAISILAHSTGLAQSRDSTVTQPAAISAFVAEMRKLATVRDSLTVLADGTSGTAHDYVEELIWQRHLELQTRVLDMARRVKLEQDRGGNVLAIRQALNAGVRAQWPRYLAQLQRRERILTELAKASATVAGAERLAIETQLTQNSDRLLESLRGLVDLIRALEKINVDVSEPRAFLLEKLPATTEGLVARIRLAGRERASASARLARDGSNADVRNAFDAADERFKRSSQALSTAILLMDELGVETSDLRVTLISTTGRINADIFKWKVAVGLLENLWHRLVEFLAVKAPQWLFQGLLIALTLIGFRALAKIVRHIVRRAVKYSNVSELMRSTIVQVSSSAVYLIGLLVILTQLGVQVAPLLAGLGIAGFIVGFAMQSTLSNFAAGTMILSNRPYDMGDEIEVSGASGIVRKMSLVSTTIITADNQTLIIPNNTIWGGVIRNRTSQPLRRVDLTFAIGYRDNIEKAERVLRDIVEANENVVKDPAPIIKVHQLADSSVNFAVRAWAANERYWDVYWDVTRAVKLRFDTEGISIPFPQRELHVKIEKGQLTGPP